MARLLKKEIEKGQAKVSIQELANKFFMTRTEEAYQELYLRMHWGLRKYISKYINKSIDDCNDVVVDVLEKVWTKIDMYDPLKAQFSTWLYRVARNEALLFLMSKNKRKNKEYDNDITDIYTKTLTTKNGVDSNFIVYDDYNFSLTDDGLEKRSYDNVIDDMYDVSVSCIAKLPDNYRLALTEKYINKKTIDQIAYDNQIKKTTLVNWIYNGKNVVKEMIKYEYKDLYGEYELGAENYASE